MSLRNARCNDKDLPTLFHKRHDYRKKKFLNIKCVLRFSLQRLSETFFILRRTERDKIKIVRWSSYKVRFIPARF